MHGRNTRDGSESAGLAPTKLLRVPDAARELAVSVRTVWRLVSLGELDSVRVGRSVRIARASIDQFVAKGGAR